MLNHDFIMFRLQTGLNGESFVFGDFNCPPVIIFHYGMLLAAVE